MNKKKQKKVSRNNSRVRNEGTDLGDFAKKIMHGISSTYKTGGVGLVVLAIGAVAFLFLFLLGNSMENRNFYTLLIVSILIMVFGIFILIKEKTTNG